ncbi:hypothetical protein [Nocardia sp. NPDC057353]|uniref:hypothetical protein n=1 Tax=Nocardia sp. NPDC057353 TaxID=3346104 RepID=UPI00363CAA14
MTDSYSQWYERHSPPGKILAGQYTSAEPIRYNGSLVYPMYSEEFGTPGARLAMTALSAAPPAGLRGWGIGLSVLDGHVRFDGRRLGGIDVWGDALATGISVELAGHSPQALFTLTPVWVDNQGVQKSWEGNYGILVEHLPDGRITLWCSVGEGPPNFANLVVEISTDALDAAPAVPQETEAQLLDDQYVTLPIRYRAERPDGGRVVLVDTAAEPRVEAPAAPVEEKAARRGGGWVSRRDYAPPADGSAGRWDRQAPDGGAVRRPSGELPAVPEGLAGEESPFGPGVTGAGPNSAPTRVGGVPGPGATRNGQVPPARGGDRSAVAETKDGRTGAVDSAAAQAGTGAERRVDDRPAPGRDGAAVGARQGGKQQRDLPERTGAAYGPSDTRSAGRPANAAAKPRQSTERMGEEQAPDAAQPMARPAHAGAEPARNDGQPAVPLPNRGVEHAQSDGQPATPPRRGGAEHAKNDAPPATRPTNVGTKHAQSDGQPATPPRRSGAEHAQNDAPPAAPPRRSGAEQAQNDGQPATRPATVGTKHVQNDGQPAAPPRRGGAEQVRNDGQSVARFEGAGGEAEGGQQAGSGGGGHVLPTRAGRRPDIRESKYGQRPTAASETLTGGRHGQQARPATTGGQPGANLAAGLHGMRGDESDRRRESFAARLQALRGERPARSHGSEAPEGHRPGGAERPSGGAAPGRGAGGGSGPQRLGRTGAVDRESGGREESAPDAATTGLGARPEHATNADATVSRRSGHDRLIPSEDHGQTPLRADARQQPAPSSTPHGRDLRGEPGHPPQGPTENRQKPTPSGALGNPDRDQPAPARADNRPSQAAPRSGAATPVVGDRPEEVAPGPGTLPPRTGTPEETAATTARRAPQQPGENPPGSEAVGPEAALPAGTGRDTARASEAGTAAPAGNRRDTSAVPAQNSRNYTATPAADRRDDSPAPTRGGRDNSQAPARTSRNTPAAPTDSGPAGAATQAGPSRDDSAAPRRSSAATPETTPQRDSTPPPRTGRSDAAIPGGISRDNPTPPARHSAAGPGGIPRDDSTPPARTSAARTGGIPRDDSTPPARTSAARTGDVPRDDSAPPARAGTDAPAGGSRDAAAVAGGSRPDPATSAGSGHEGATTPKHTTRDSGTARRADGGESAGTPLTPTGADQPDTPGKPETTGFGGWSAATLQHNPDTLPPRRSVYGPPPVPRGQGGIIGDPGYRGALYDLGLAMYRRGDTESARGLLTQAAEAGHVAAAYDLGALLRDEGDTASAEAWWRAAAAHGEPRAAASLEELRGE